MDGKNPKRPRDPNQLAKSIVDIATAAPEEAVKVDSSAKVKAGAKGGESRARQLTPHQREEIARLAAQARWKKD